MSNFKCYNCGSALSKTTDHLYTYYRCYSNCKPHNNYYNSFIMFFDNKIAQYGFVFIYNNLYHKIESRTYPSDITYIYSDVDGTYNSRMKFVKLLLEVNKYFPITESYIEELPALINNLMSLTIFV
jgi:hypothetical protein